MSKFETLVDHGVAPYKNDSSKGASYFAKLQNENGVEKTVWGVDLARSIDESGAQIGDKVSLSRGEKKAVTIQEKDENGKLVEKTVERVEWITKVAPAQEVSAETEVEVVNTPAATAMNDGAKREALADEYEQEIAPVREARTEAIEAHEKEFSDKWAAMQGQMSKIRSDLSSKLADEHVPAKHHEQIISLEIARLVEQHETAKHAAAIKIDKDMPPPKKWGDFLEEKSVGQDPVVLELLAEAKQAPEPSLSGVSDGVPRKVVLSDIEIKAEKDHIKYLRGKDEIITDRGHRLDVKRLDDRDIQAALLIASQKFDTEKGLVLSGDVAFRTRSAEIAGRLGLNVQNMSPEMQRAWDRGQKTAAVLQQPARPNIANSIAGEAKQPEPVLLKVDERINIQKLTEMGSVNEGPNANSVLMNPENYMGAMDAWRNTDSKTLEALSHADINKPDGGLDVSEIAGAAPELVQGDKLSLLAKELVLVRDAKTLDAREHAQNPEMYKTSQDRVAEDKALQQQADKQLLVRNIDDQDQEKSKEHAVKTDQANALKEHEKEHDHESGLGF